MAEGSPEQVEEKSVAFDAVKAGIELEPGHRTVLILEDLHGHGSGDGDPPPPPHADPPPPPPHDPPPHGGPKPPPPPHDPPPHGGPKPPPPPHEPPPHGGPKPPPPPHEPPPHGGPKPPPPHQQPPPKPHEPPPADPHKLPAPYDKWQTFIEAAAKKHKVPGAFVTAVMARESAGRNVIGDHGHAHGLLQIDDRHHEEWLKKNKQGMDPASNVDYGAQLLRVLIDAAQAEKLSGDAALKFAAAAWNAGLAAAQSGQKKGDCDLLTLDRHFGAEVMKEMKTFEKHFDDNAVQPGKPPGKSPPPPGHHTGHGHPGGNKHPAHTDPPPSGNEDERAYQFGKHALGKWIHDLKKEAPWSHYLDSGVPDNECCSNFVSACLQQAGLITHDMHRDNVNDLSAVLEKHAHWQKVSLAQASQGDFVRLVTGAGLNDRHAVMYSHAEKGQHFFLGSNNVESRPGHPQQISIQEMGYTVESVHHYKGVNKPPRPAGTPHPTHEGRPDTKELPELMRQWAPFVEEAAKKHDLPPAFIAAVIDRETGGGHNEIGDYGHGHGLMQIDNRSHEDWLKAHDNGMDPKSNIDYGSSLLRANLDVAIQSLKLKGSAALKFAASAYNAGVGGAENGLSRYHDSDAFTTAPPYGHDVLEKMKLYEKGFGLRPVRPADNQPHPAGGHPGHHPGHGSHGSGHPAQPSGSDEVRAYDIGVHESDRTIESLKHDPHWSHYLDGVPDGECCANFVSACYQKAGLLAQGLHSDSVYGLISNLEKSGHWLKVHDIAHAQKGDYVALKTSSEHAVMYSHAQVNRHFFLGSNNISSSMQMISVEEMTYPIISIWRHKGAPPPPRPARPPEGHALVDVTLLDAEHKGKALAGAHVEVTAFGQKHDTQTDPHGRVILHLAGKTAGNFSLVVQSQGQDAGKAEPAKPPTHKPSGDHGSTQETKQNVTVRELREIMPDAEQAKLDKYCAPLNKAMREFHINTPRRQAAFIAQIAEETGSLMWVQELSSGAEYQGMLGNTHPGDGERYKGRGLIQITGRDNYEAVQNALDINCVGNPNLLDGAVDACRASCWWWYAHGLNGVADEGNFLECTRIINGGYNGLSEREMFWARAKQVLGNSKR